MIHNKAEWTKWEDILNTNASLPRDVYAGNMIIPTLDTVRWMEACVGKIWTLHPIPHRYQHILSLLASHDKPFLLVGPSGTGKTVYIKVAWSPLLLSIKSPPPQDMLNRKLDKEKFASTALFFTKITTPRTVQVKLALLIVHCVVISSWFLDSGYHYEQA